MTLEKTWEECLRMWKWIAGIKLDKINYSLRGTDVLRLKEIWLNANNYVDVYNDCFFCDYATKAHGGVDPGSCKNCPAQFVEAGFNCCAYPNYASKPIEFYNLLVELNKKRLSKKGKR